MGTYDFICGNIPLSAFGEVKPKRFTIEGDEGTVQVIMDDLVNLVTIKFEDEYQLTEGVIGKEIVYCD